MNGFGGVDLLATDAEGYKLAGEALLETGVTSYLPTFITAPEDELVAALEAVPKDSNGGPRILGAHVEGPFLSPARVGTHPLASLRDPDPALLERIVAAGPVVLVTLAPELPGADELIDLLLARGITVSLGHTDASAAEANAAFDRGVRTVTHLFNAMRPFRHRDPGVAGAALARPDVIVQIIVDGIHLAPETAQLVWQAAGGRVVLVTDAVAGAGVSDGSYSLGGLEVDVRDGVARGPDGVLAGSALTMVEAVRNLHALGVPLADALGAATAVPARVIGRDDVGRLGVGLPADVVVLGDDLAVERVLVGRRRACRCLSPSRPSRPRSAPASSPRSTSSPQRSSACSSTRTSTRASPPTARERGATTIRMVGHGSSDNAAAYGVYAFGLLPGWTALRDSITLTVYYGARARPARLDRDRALAVGSHAGRGRLRRAGARGRGVHGRADERPGLRAGRAWPRPCCRSAPGPERSIAATKTYTNKVAALALLAGHAAGRGAELAPGSASRPRASTR